MASLLIFSRLTATFRYENMILSIVRRFYWDFRLDLIKRILLKFAWRTINTLLVVSRCPKHINIFIVWCLGFWWFRPLIFFGIGETNLCNWVIVFVSNFFRRFILKRWKRDVFFTILWFFLCLCAYGVLFAFVFHENTNLVINLMLKVNYLR